MMRLAEAERSLEQALKDRIEGEVRFDKVSRAIYSTDAGVYEMIPAGVVIPQSREDVINTVAACSEHEISITARGGGTSQAGQAIGKGIQLDYSKYLNRIIKLDIENRTVEVEPGIVLDELNFQLAPHGLHLPLDISTSNCATIGGMINNNSAGTRSILYGITIDYVLELTVVLSDCRVVRLEPFDQTTLDSKCEQNDTEGRSYRVVRDLAKLHREEILDRYPKIQRRVGGYNLDSFTQSEGSGEFNLCKMIVGSEGTLAQVLAAKLRLVELPKRRAVVSVQFRDLLQAMAATPLILKHKPSAVELVDDLILGMTRGKPKFEPLRSFIEGDPKAVLIVEFTEEGSIELPDRVEHLITELRESGYGYHFHRAFDKSAQGRIWNLRKAGLGLCMAQRGDAKSISFVEDTAVDPDNLHDYIRDFVEVLKDHDTEAGFYAHASVGLLHIRPVVNMKSEDGVAKFASIAQKISDLVLKYSGALSGEHGDGLVRAPFQEKMYGSTLYRAFQEIKQTFDPKGLFNPGKIVDAPELTANLRFGPAYRTPDLTTAFDFSDFGGLARAAEQCGGVGNCRKSLEGTMCPSYMATREERDSTRGRANALRMALNGRMGREGLTDPALYPVFDLCLECKACKTECPTGVDMARMKSEFLHQYAKQNGRNLRSRLMGQTRRLAEWGSRLAPLSNWLCQSPITRRLINPLLGIAARRSPPQFSSKTFVSWCRKNEIGSDRGVRDGERIALFPDTFTSFFEPEIAQSAYRVAQHLGTDVTVVEPVCCGRPMISKGLLNEASRLATKLLSALDPVVEDNIPIVFCEPSCYSAVTDDFLHLTKGADRARAERVAQAAVLFDDWALHRIGELQATQVDVASHHPHSNGSKLLKSGPSQVIIHNHCHQKALLGNDVTELLLKNIPDCEITTLNTTCCGMAGSFGYEKEHYAISRAVGEQRLFPAIRNASQDTVVIANGFSCRHQISHFTGVQPMAAVTLLETLLRGEDD